MQQRPRRLQALSPYRCWSSIRRPRLSFTTVEARLGSGDPQRASSASSAGPPPKPSGWATFWGAVDKGAWLGAIGTAAAFIITQEAILASAQVALPLLALYASKQRERLTAEVGRH